MADTVARDLTANGGRHRRAGISGRTAVVDAAPPRFTGLGFHAEDRDRAQAPRKARARSDAPRSRAAEGEGLAALPELGADGSPSLTVLMSGKPDAGLVVRNLARCFGARC